MKKLKKFFTEERVDEIYETMFDLAMGLGIRQYYPQGKYI